jgi:hypothetical protein
MEDPHLTIHLYRHIGKHYATNGGQTLAALKQRNPRVATNRQPRPNLPARERHRFRSDEAPLMQMRLVAGGRNAPNALLLPFRVELTPAC